MSSSAAIPSGRVPPSGLGISTRRTGGARYAPPLCRRRCRSSRRSSRPSPYMSHVTPSTPAAASRLKAWNAQCSASGVIWWKSAVRRSFGFLSAAFRIRAAACGTLARRRVRRVIWQSGFPLVEALSLRRLQQKLRRSSLVRRPHRSYGLIRLLQTVHHRLRFSPFPTRPLYDKRGSLKTSQGPDRRRANVHGFSDTAGLADISPKRRLRYCLRPI